YRLVGQEIRFLRKYVKKTGYELAQLLGVDKTTISKWENNDDHIGTSSDRLLRAILLGLCEPLHDEMQRTIRHFSEINSEPLEVEISLNAEDLSCQYA